MGGTATRHHLVWLPWLPMSVVAATGFSAAAGTAGIKASGDLDLALIAADSGTVPAAGVFTRNRVQAAPVKWSRSLLRHQGRAAGVILNAGNANAATGPEGDDAAERMARAAGDSYLVCSTGLIGIPFPIEKVEKTVPGLRDRLSSSTQAGDDAARAIMTTDTRPKQAVAKNGGVTVGGMAKGAAMLHPDMATMLAVITTDAVATTEQLQAWLGTAADRTFNRITVDGCTSTNDTVLLLASGASGVNADIGAAVAKVCGDLAEQMVRDAEGATRFARILVTGARSESDAVAAARKIATSDLVRCSLFGGDPYWGRIVSEIGVSGVPVDPDRLRVWYGDTQVCDAGAPMTHSAVTLGDEVLIRADLGMGSAEAEMLTCDLSHGYVDENKGTS